MEAEPILAMSIVGRLLEEASWNTPHATVKAAEGERTC